MTHYWVVYSHEGRNGVCRTDIDDARMDIIDELGKGMKIALDSADLYEVNHIACAMVSASTLDPYDEYEAEYDSISQVEVGHRTWRIERSWSCGCGNDKPRRASW